MLKTSIHISYKYDANNFHLVMIQMLQESNERAIKLVVGGKPVGECLCHDAMCMHSCIDWQHENVMLLWPTGWKVNPMHALLRVHSAVQRHQSPERPTLCQSLALFIPRSSKDRSPWNVLHASCAWLPWWSPPLVLWTSFEYGLDSIWVLIHSCKMPNERTNTYKISNVL